MTGQTSSHRLALYRITETTTWKAPDLELPLVVDPSGNVPLYQQLKHQLVYLISSQQLPGGSRLPTIRELAEALEINIGTVAQAYRDLQVEGLVVSQKGRGTFVKEVLPPRYGEESAAREETLGRALESAIALGVSLGFTSSEIQHRLGSLLTQRAWRCQLAFVGPTPPIAHKHAHLLEDCLSSLGVEVHAISIDELRQGHEPDAFRHVYYTLTFRGLARQVQSELDRRHQDRRLLVVATRVTDYTLGALGMLTRDVNACLVAEQENRHSALNLVTNHSPLPTSIPVAALEEPERVAEICQTSAVVIHTFSSIPLLDELGVPAHKRLELRFEIDPDFVLALQQVLQPVRHTSLAVGVGS